MSFSPALVDFKHMRFLITSAPDPLQLKHAVTNMKKHNVTKLVRLCACEYDTSLFAKAGIEVVDLPFPDGKAPPNDVLIKWNEIVREFDFGTIEPPSTTSAAQFSVHSTSGSL